MTQVLHAICGLPRAGSTLLCNILAQNPRLRISSTSPLAGTLTAMQNRWSQCPEIQAHLIRDREGTLARMREAMHAVAQSLEGGPEPVMVNKCRLWNQSLRLFEWLYPQGKLIVLVRDLRAIFGSLEKQHARSAIFEYAEAPLQRTLMARSNQAFAETGAIGRDLAGVHDLIRRARSGADDAVYFIRYEDLVAKPRKTLRDLYEELGEEDFPHNFDDVQNVSGDVDALYHLKFPHDGSGKVEARPDDWDRWVSKDLAGQLERAYPAFCKMFRYGD